MTLAYNLSQLANFVNSSGQVDAATGLTNTSSLGFPTGTLMLFQQTAAPTGWTKQTTHNDKALRVVSGTASSGGSYAFSTVFQNQTPTISVSGSASATTLTTSQMPSHTHIGSGAAGNYYGSVGNTGFNYWGWDNAINDRDTYGITAAEGGGASHTHSWSGSASSSVITLAVQYVDLIICQKN